MKLIKLKTGKYKLQLDDQTIEGSLMFIRDYMFSELGILTTEIGAAVQDMESKGNDTADFGVDGTFNFTSDSSRVRRVMAELQAVRSLRLELHESLISDRGALETHDVGTRLMNMYIALDVESILELLGDMPDDVSQYAA